MKKATTQPARRSKFSSFKQAQNFMGPPPILASEDPRDYYALGQAVWKARKPREFMGVISVIDITYYIWAGNRMRRANVHFIDAGRATEVKNLITFITGKNFDAAFWEKWSAGDEESTKIVNSHLKRAGKSESTIASKAVVDKIDLLEKLERQSAQFDSRKLVTIREADLYREREELRRERLSQQKKMIDRPTSRSNVSGEQDHFDEPRRDVSFEVVE
jgi:hypothetical protein